MKLLTLVLCWAVLTTSATASSSSPYNVGDTLNCFALSGLNLRATPDPKGAKIMNVPFRSKLIVVDAESFSHPYAVSESHGFMIEGHWIKVHYQDTTGYVFDGYLSKMPVPTAGNELAYLKLISTQTSEKTTKLKRPVNYSSVLTTTEWHFANNCRLEAQTEVSEGVESGESVIYFPESLVSYREVYLIVNVLLKLAIPEERGRKAVPTPKSSIYSYDKPKGELYCTNADMTVSSTYCQIVKQKGFIVATLGAWDFGIGDN